MNRFILSAAVALAGSSMMAGTSAEAAPPASIFLECNSLQAVEMLPSGRDIAMVNRDPGKRARLMVVSLESKEAQRTWP